MTKIKHPSDRAQRKRLAAAKALANPLFHQRKINPTKRKKLLEIKDQESKSEELFYTDVGNLNSD